MSDNSYGWRLFREVSDLSAFPSDADWLTLQSSVGVKDFFRAKESPSNLVSGATKKIAMTYVVKDTNGDIVPDSSYLLTLQLLEVATIPGNNETAILDLGTNSNESPYTLIVTDNVGVTSSRGLIVRLTAPTLPGTGSLEVWAKEL